jgi:hypothetical protein
MNTKKELFETDTERLLNVNDKIIKQNNLILFAQNIVAETEYIAININNNLQENREKIYSTRNKVHQTTGLTDTARRLINSMNKREFQHKYIIIFIAFVIISAIFIVAWYCY